jgi:hypothetical protein
MQMQRVAPRPDQAQTGNSTWTTPINYGLRYIGASTPLRSKYFTLLILMNKIGLNLSTFVLIPISIPIKITSPPV